jgi:hypothetical protein
MPTRIKHCPFCPPGAPSVREIEQREAVPQVWHVTCTCGARGSGGPTRQIALQLWNNHTSEGGKRAIGTGPNTRACWK